MNLEGCDETALTPYAYSETPIVITEEDLINMGGSIEYYTLAVIISYVDSSSGTCPIEIIRTFTAQDSCDTVDSDTQSILITDSIPPAASNPPSISIECIDDLPQPDITVVIDEADNCSTPTVTFVSDASDGLTCPETITRTYSVTDECDNSISITQTITINDTTPPTSNSLQPITGIECIDDIPQPDISLLDTIADNCSVPNVTFISDVSNNQTCPETITRTYRVTDECDNYIDVPQTIIIQDTTGPELISPLTPSISVSCNDIPEIPLLEFSDSCLSILDVEFNEITISISTDSYKIIRTWNVSDTCDNSNTFTQEILVSIAAENELISTSICINDAPIDLNNFLTNTSATNGSWQSDFPDILDGSIFNPANVTVGSYEFTYSYTNDYSCIFKTTVNVGMNDDCVECVKVSTDNIKVSKLVTPNNDGLNDFMEIKYDIKNTNARLCAFSISLDIYNRWGTKVYSNENYDNSWQGSAPVNSIGPSDALPTGTYYYIIKFNDTAEKTNPIQGYILLGSK